MRCSACQAVHYCGRDHQTSDRPTHKKACTIVKKARVKLDQEETNLRELPSDFLTPPNLFENAVGHFWGYIETRPYMRARYGLVDKLLMNFGGAGAPVDVVQTCLDHLLDMIRLCRSDNMGVRDSIPALYIRLGRDQDAYDFMKWYGTTGEEMDYDWSNIDLPFLDVKDADVLEAPVKRWTSKYLSLSHAMCVSLIKIHVLLDLVAMQNVTRALRGNSLPPEIIDIIRSHVISRTVSARFLRADTNEVSRHIKTIKAQLKQIFRGIRTYNPSFWPAMLEDGYAAMAARPNEPYAHQTREEACLVLSFNFVSWDETPGAVNIIRCLAKEY